MMLRLWRFFCVVLVLAALVDNKVALAESWVDVEQIVYPEYNLGQIKRVAVLPFKTDRNDRVSNTLGSLLHKTGKFKLLERTKLDQIMQMQKEWMVGIIDDESIGEIGQILGVEAIIYGEVLVNTVTDEDVQEVVKVPYEEVYYDKNGKKKTRTAYNEVMAKGKRRYGEFEVSLKVGEVETAERLVHSTLAPEPYKQTQIIHKNASSEQKKVLKAKREVETELMGTALDEFLHSILPHHKSIRVQLDEYCKECVGDLTPLRFIQDGLYPQALKALEAQEEELMTRKSVRKKKKGDDRTLSSVYYNRAVVAELEGDYEGALELYSKAYEIRVKKPSKKLKKALDRVNSHLKEKEIYLSKAGEEDGF